MNIQNKGLRSIHIILFFFYPTHPLILGEKKKQFLSFKMLDRVNEKYILQVESFFNELPMVRFLHRQVNYYVPHI